MTETEFLDEVARVWQAIESRVDEWVERVDVDMEVMRHGPVLELEFATGRKIVVNPQAPMQQIWLASPRGAFHFQWRNGQWCDTRDGQDFWAVLRTQTGLEAGIVLSR